MGPFSEQYRNCSSLLLQMTYMSDMAAFKLTVPWAAPQVLNCVCLFPLPPLPFPTSHPHRSLHSLPLPSRPGCIFTNAR